MLHVLDAINNAARFHLPAITRRNGDIGRTEFAQSVPERPALDVLTSILADLFSDLDIETTISRRGVTYNYVRSIIDTVVTAVLTISGVVKPYELDLTDVQALKTALTVANHINLDFSRLSKAHWKYSLKQAEECATHELQEVVAAWLDLARFGNINMPDSPRTVQMIKGLHLLGISADRITVRINPHPQEDDKSVLRSINYLKQCFQLHYGAAPQFERNRHRRGKLGPLGRERMYLHVLTRAINPGEVAPPALNDTKTLNALLLSALVYSTIGTDA